MLRRQFGTKGAFLFAPITTARRFAASSTTTTTTVTTTTTTTTSSTGNAATQTPADRATNYFQQVQLIPDNRFEGIAGNVSAFNCDWDDNIFFMPTKVAVFPRKNSNNLEPKEITTAKFADIRELLGRPGSEWENYETTDQTFRGFSDADPNRNFFLEDIKKAVDGDSNNTSWQGPSWRAFVYATSTPERARATTIITARQHSPFTMLEGLHALKERGFIQHAPPFFNLYGVSYPPLQKVIGSDGGSANPSEAKTKIMMRMLDNIQSIPIKDGKSGGRLVDCPEDPTKQRYLHLWGFSDDDKGNFDAALKALAPEVKRGRWSNIKLTLFHTAGEKTIVVLKSDGTTRPAGPNEAIFARVVPTNSKDGLKQS